MPPLVRDRAEEMRLRRAKLGAGPLDVVPNPGPQEAFLSCVADEVLYGGAAGGGKSMALLLAALRYVHVPGYRALIMRRTGPQLSKQLIPRARALYPRMYPPGHVEWRATDRVFIFPSGATIEFAAADKEKHIERLQGFEWAFIAFDELTAFTAYQYSFMFSRLRTTARDPDTGAELPLRVRAGTNPGGEGHDWVLKRWAPWLYPPGHPEYQGPLAETGRALWFAPLPGDDDEGEIIVPAGSEGGTARTFIASRVSDTPQLGADYEAKALGNLDPLTRKRLKHGDWMARDVAGEFFQRSWFPIVDYAPAPSDVVARIRYWDLAGTAQTKATPTSAWTAGALVSITWEGEITIEHIQRGQLSPGDVERTIAQTQIADEIESADTETIIERDPAQAGKFQAFYFARELGIKAIPPNGDKLTRARPVSAKAEAGLVRLVRTIDGARWIDPFLREAESFPEATKDQIDAVSGAVRLLLIKWMKARGGGGRGRRGRR